MRVLVKDFKFKEEPPAIDTLVLLNSPIAFPNTVTYTQRLTIEDARKIINNAKKIVSYIGHDATAKLIEDMFKIKVPVNRQEFKPSTDYFAMVFRLKKRLEKPEDIKNITIDDIEILLMQSYIV